MSRVVVFDEYGDPEVLHLVEVEPPEPGPGQVRVRVVAAGVQPFDVKFRGGLVSWAKAKFPQRLGNEVAGVVDVVGPDVAGFAVGDDVLGHVASGGHADHALVDVAQLAHKPADMPWEVAGALTASGQTAVTVCRDLRVASGETLLVHAAAGGVGSFAVQIARAHGATVVGTASPGNHDYLRSLGAVPVAYGDGLVDRVRAVAPHGVDAALDAAGTEEALRASVELVTDVHRACAIADGDLAGEFGVRFVVGKNSTSQLAELVDLYEKGELRVEVHRTFDLADAAAAHRAVETRHVRGKVVLVTG